MTSRKRVGKLSSESGKLEEKTFIELLQTADRLARGVAALLKTEDLSSPQYNVLRILRGSPAGLPCGEISRRLLTREPDITRLLDRMEKRGFIVRYREPRDRRTVITTLTRAGIDTVNRLDAPMQTLHRQQLGHLGRERMQSLMELLRAARKAQ